MPLDRHGGGGFVRVFGAPLAIAFVSAIGLLSALFADGLWDVLSWGALATPLAVVLRYSVWRRRP